ncbi:UvrD-helicase domain-containing protein [Xylanibacter oryzae]|uniref:UvrD-helicase domain-containing protein n=1 Tax=Xylanibacter oryzae TaxID=185293 RepID=UPI0005670026|nr:ATP-dependent helicase [Xylanibacter oryzae]
MEPTEVQKKIIENDGNTLVLASPGSGKTFVISEMVRRILKKDEILPYQGVIAISYTRKASSNLKERTLSEGLFIKNSFFGTIDNFCLTQIVLSFVNYVWGAINQDPEIIGINDIPKEDKGNYIWLKDNHPDYNLVTGERWHTLMTLYSKGYFLVESLELIALYILKNCAACQNYVKSRFKYIYIDEFQDADTYTNDIFLQLIDLGLTGVAVGDENQSIFGFAHKDSRYLTALKDNINFKTFELKDNFRCSAPIVNYSNRLIDKESQLLDTDENGVFLVKVDGGEERIADFIEKYMGRLCKKWDVKDYSKVAILVKNTRTQAMINDSLTIPHRVIETTPLDIDLNPRSRLFTLLLRFYLDKKYSMINVLDEFVDYEELTIYDRKTFLVCFNSIRENSKCDKEFLVLSFNNIANLLLPKIGVGASLTLLKEVIDNDNLFSSYKPLEDNEVLLMTLHKSKGLEFDIVFHLNLNEWELPSKTVKFNDFKHPKYINWNQDLNLHYVGLTRARKACYIVRSSLRTNNNGETKNAFDSEFLDMNHLSDLRKNYRYK